MKRAGRIALTLGCLLLCACSVTTAQDIDEDTHKKDASSVDPERKRPTDNDALRAAAFEPARMYARRRALMESLPEDAIVVVVNPVPESDLHPYRPNPDFLYLSGLTDPGLSLLISAEDDVLFAPAFDAFYERWNGNRLSVGTDAAKACGFRTVTLKKRRVELLKAATRRGASIYLSGAKPADLGLDPEAVKSAAGKIARLRQVKDRGEIALLRRAIDVTSSALREAMSSLRPGQFEYEIEATIEYVFKRYGAQRPGFASIIGSGPNTCVLHYSSNRRRSVDGDLVVMDVGAELHGYTADVTRTVPVNGRFTPRQREIYEIVLAAQQAGFDAVRPGAKVRDVHAAASKVIREAGYAKYFLHSTSHWLGLDVHDVGPMSRTLEPGMVLTVEPGIYIAKEELGIRIEDDVLVTKDGRRVLSDGVPRGVKEIEALMTRKGVGAGDVAPLPARGKGSGKTRYFQVAPRGVPGVR